MILKRMYLYVQAASTRSLARGTDFDSIISMLKEVQFFETIFYLLSIYLCHTIDFCVHCYLVKTIFCDVLNG